MKIENDFFKFGTKIVIYLSLPVYLKNDENGY